MAQSSSRTKNVFLTAPLWGCATPTGLRVPSGASICDNSPQDLQPAPLPPPRARTLEVRRDATQPWLTAITVYTFRSDCGAWYFKETQMYFHSQPLSVSSKVWITSCTAYDYWFSNSRLLHTYIGQMSSRQDISWLTSLFRDNMRVFFKF